MDGECAKYKSSKEDDDDEFVNKILYAYSLAASAFLSEFIVSFTISIDGYFVSLLPIRSFTFKMLPFDLFYWCSYLREEKKLAFYFLNQKCLVAHFESWNTTMKCFIVVVDYVLSFSIEIFFLFWILRYNSKRSNRISITLSSSYWMKFNVFN